VLWMFAMGLADLWGIVVLHCQKVESTEWLKHKRCANGLNKPMADLGFSFPLRFGKRWLEFVKHAFGGSPKLFSSGIAISMTNRIDCSELVTSYTKLCKMNQSYKMNLQRTDHRAGSNCAKWKTCMTHKIPI
jgi:hypothetical protein